jgi:aspartate dehydrogenase
MNRSDTAAPSPIPTPFTMIGWGAIAKSLHARLAAIPSARLERVIVRPERVQAVQRELGNAIDVRSQVPADCTLALECAGHSALIEHIEPALLRGTECAVLSIGALHENGLAERLADAAARGGTRLHLLAGAIGGIDAIAAARFAGLDEVIYTGRKPPAGWRGSPAEQVLNLDTLREPAVFLDATAREAARLYPKNANVAATISLAGLGLDATRVRLIADPGITENIHEIKVRGAFGDMELTMRGKPLSDNPRTSALTVLSALRFLANRTGSLAI